MELGINLTYLTKGRNGQVRALNEAASLCAGAGFRYVDYLSDFRQDGWKENALRERELLDGFNLTVEQSHAPYNRYGSYAPEDFGVYMKRAFEIALILGARYVVVHADEYRAADRWDPDEIIPAMYELYAPYVDFARKHGLCMAVENLFEDHCYPEVCGRSRFTSKVEEVVGLIERFNDSAVRCCWDFGHAQCAYGADHMLEALRQAGRYVVCTHVHDNYYGKDLHLMPFLGNADWEAHMAFLKEAGYQGKLSFEFAYGRLPDALMPSALRLVREAGLYLAAL